MGPVCIASTIYCDLFSSKSMVYRCKIIHLGFALKIYKSMQNFFVISQIRNMKVNVKI